MSHSADCLTGYCSEAPVMSFGAIYRSLEEAGAEDPLITGVTGEGLNCGDDKPIGKCKKECFWISKYQSFVI